MMRSPSINAIAGMPRLSRPFVVVAILLALIVGACTAPPMTIEEYADALNAATDEYIGESQSLSVAFQTAVEDEIAELAEAGEGNLLSLATGVTSRQMIQYLALLEDAMARYGEALDEMQPPESLVGPHDDYLVAIESTRIALPPTRDAVGEAHDLEDIQEAVIGSGFGDSQLRLQSSCVALEEAVRAEGQGVDLGCTRSPTDG